MTTPGHTLPLRRAGALLGLTLALCLPLLAAAQPAHPRSAAQQPVDSDWAAVQLAREMKITRPSMSRVLQRLRQQGLVEHKGGWSVTAKGRRFRAAYADRPASVWKRMFGRPEVEGAAA